MRKFGLIGKPLTHSFSKKYFEEKFQREKISDCSYDLFELNNIEEFPSLIKSNPELVGLNVTIPYKESVIPFLDDLDEGAKEIGAVNCIRVENGKLIGYNTDCHGFEDSLVKFFDKNTSKGETGETVLKSPLGDLGVFILGTGGSSKAVCYVLRKMKLPFCNVSRNSKDGYITYDEIFSQLKSFNLFINTTPLGMFPKVDVSPKIPYELLSGNDFLFDLVYNPTETEFLKRGREKGAKTKNGLEMLELQAEKSWEIWNS